MNAQFARHYLGIGEVLVELRGEFPDISVSKIRFLESEGLIAPGPVAVGLPPVRPADVDQLRFILTAQRDQYLPLRVIKERLTTRRAGPPAECRRPRRPARRGRAVASTVRRPARSEMVSRSRRCSDPAGHRRAAARRARGARPGPAGRAAVRPGRARMSPTARSPGAWHCLRGAGPAPARGQDGGRAGRLADRAGRGAHAAPAQPAAPGHAGARRPGRSPHLLLRLHRAMIEAALAEAGLPATTLAEREARPGQDGPARPGRPAGPGIKGASA